MIRDDTYVMPAEFEPQSAMIRGARGTRGANVEYISNTVEQLNTHGIYCGTLRAVYAGARGEGQ